VITAREWPRFTETNGAEKKKRISRLTGRDTGDNRFHPKKASTTGIRRS
jgi:hypothetical protein